MVARWVTFTAGLWLVFAPLALGYDAAAAVLHDVALGVVVCAVALAALEWPLVRFVQLVPAAWLAGAPGAFGWESTAVAANELAAAAGIATLSVFPSARLRRGGARRRVEPAATEAPRAA